MSIPLKDSCVPPIRQISIYGLWGIRDYKIKLRTDSRVTLIHGLNGSGKTTFLKTVSNLGRRRFLAMTSVDFHSIEILYETGTLRVTRSENMRTVDGLNNVSGPSRIRQVEKAAQNKSRSVKAVMLSFNFFHTGTGPEQGSIWEFDATDENWARRIFESVARIQRIDFDRFIDQGTRRFYSTQELIQVFADYPGVSEESCEDCPDWLKDLINMCDLRLIETQRLQRHLRSRDDDHPRYRRVQDEYNSQKTVEWCAADMRERLTKHFSLFAEKSQELDQSFAIRVIETKMTSRIGVTEIDFNTLRSRYDLLTTKQQELVEARIIGKSLMPKFKERHISDDEFRVLDIYVSDMEEKLDVFNDIFPRAKFFLTTMNSQLEGKNLRLDSKDKGIIIELKDGKSIPLTSLSSGEQHLLVLFYEVIFAQEKSTSLLMIDEPEISLHVSWQYKFVELLEKAASLSNCCAVIATHSPQIVEGREYISLGQDVESSDRNDDDNETID